MALGPPEEKSASDSAQEKEWVSEVLTQVQPSSCFVKYQGEMVVQVLQQPCLQQLVLWPAEAHFQDFVGKECFCDKGTLVSWHWYSWFAIATLSGCLRERLRNTSRCFCWLPKSIWERGLVLCRTWRQRQDASPSMTRKSSHHRRDDGAESSNGEERQLCQASVSIQLWFWLFCPINPN